MLYKFLDPKNDFAFKRIFGTEKHKNILMHFLNDTLSFSQQDKNESDLDRITGADDVIRQAYEVLNPFSWTPEELHTMNEKKNENSMRNPFFYMQK